MRTITSLFAAALLACSMSAMAANDSVNADDDTNIARNDSPDSATNATADDGRGSDANAVDLSGTDGQPPHDEDELVRDDDDDRIGTDDDDLARNDSDRVSRNDGRGNTANSDVPGSVVRDNTAKSEYNNECAWGLANGQHIPTTCAVNMTTENGKTYCFRNDRAMAAFMRDPERNMSKADSAYERS